MITSRFPVALLCAVLAAVPAGPALSADAPSKPPAAQKAIRESARFLEAVEPLVRAYAQNARQYSSDPGPGSSWYGRKLELDLSKLPQPQSAEDKELHRVFGELLRYRESFFNSHRLAFEEGERLMTEENRSNPAVRFGLIGLGATLGQSYKRWREYHGYLVPIAEKRFGLLLPRLPFPPYLAKIQAYTKEPAPAGEK
ncbi:MAG: hypothetical protein AB1405_14560 [Bdellovibrionota bacterium]